MPTDSTTPKPGLFSYFSESWDELKKVHTPTRQETIRNTMVVLFIILIVSVCLFLVDMFFSWFMSRIVA